MFSRRFFAALTLCAVFAGAAYAATGANSMDQATEEKLKSLLAGPQRTAGNVTRDQYRHPLETLKFMGLKQDMTVLEVWPGGGYWTEFLAPLLAEKGRYIAAGLDPDMNSDYVRKSVTAFKEKLEKDPATYGKVEVTVLSPGTSKVTPVPPGSVDMVLTFRNLHGWMSQGQDKVMLASLHAALKPGGYLGIKDHRASTAADQDPKAKSGYVREDYAIKLIESVGFKLVSKSEVNANPKDTKDYAKGVWTLPPNLRGDEADKAKYTAIGESDRFTLLFQKK